ncbi:hypothetical protein HSACCH_02463 [Halanaerobium saccharolyticum subsp. saccharolyticum DSM 6643]|uniref:HTH cro/C1-type domain-containing protein n=1 Tax=Halanaerobium saccharolyticum subsp. saccharolyticum DSM 6643 TaxID=1293054 RepID=M5E416_9FIRM|nr:helix-turn-helix transcriptional regulator [Halanaerobium saccharolyticum]CCU80962.1 hypothetical protein HSACCH_02463 [Halanaerobium saccharolyticum subsp. saccharolyticum DSM 6643]
MKDLNKIVAHNIKNKLDEIKMSRADFATKLGTSLQGINEIINYRRDITEFGRESLAYVNGRG